MQSTRPTIANRIDRWLLRKSFAMERPGLAIDVIELRRRLAGGQRRPYQPLAPDWRGFVDPKIGFRAFGKDFLPQAEQVVAACKAIFARHAEATQNVEDFNKSYFFNLADLDDLKANPVLLDLAFGPQLASIATDYLGNARLNSIGVFYSGPGSSMEGSQLFHVDGDCRRQLKCFVHAWDVDETSGPFTTYPANGTTRELRDLGLMKKLEDADLARRMQPAEAMPMVGEAGSGLFCDTSRCLHQGSRARGAARLVLCIQYVSRPDALLAGSQARSAKGRHILVTDAALKQIGYEHPAAETLVG